jgi:RHH-type rel operon transcriptional repressor/antitoxin RelB
MLAIRLPVKMDRRLAALAKKTGRTKTFYAREAIVEHLGDLEDLYLVKRRLADIDEGRTQLVPLEVAMRKRNL